MGVDFGALTLNSKLEGSKTSQMMMKTPMYAEGTCSASTVHTFGDKGIRRYNHAIQFQADSGYAQITTHSNTKLLKGPGNLVSSLEKKNLFLDQVSC